MSHFLKLHKAGLPIPGKLPPQRNKNRFFKTGGKKTRHGKNTHPLTSRKSTFLTSLIPEVRMDEDSCSSSPLEIEKRGTVNDLDNVDDTSSSDEEFPDYVKNTDEYKELKLLLRVRREKEFELNEGTEEHEGFSCSRCKQNPLLGTRWHCTVCQGRSEEDVEGVDLCNDCLLMEYQGGGHLLHHKMIAVRQRTDKCDLKDEDYM